MRDAQIYAAKLRDRVRGAVSHVNEVSGGSSPSSTSTPLLSFVRQVSMSPSAGDAGPKFAKLGMAIVSCMDVL